MSEKTKNQDIVIRRNSAGQLYICHTNGESFDISEHINKRFTPMQPSPNEPVAVLHEVAMERERQERKGYTLETDAIRKDNLDFVEDIISYALWAGQMDRMGSPEKYRHRMLQIAALAVAACEVFDYHKVTGEEA